MKHPHILTTESPNPSRLPRERADALLEDLLDQMLDTLTKSVWDAAR